MAFSAELTIDEMTTSVTSDGRLVKEYVREYLCKNETALTNDEVASNIGTLPGAPHPNWDPARCNRINVSRLMTKEPHCKWKAHYDYSTEATVPEDDSDTDPELRRVNRKTGTSQQQRFIVRDKNGDLIVDTAGSAFDGGVPVTDYLGTMSFERDETHTSDSMSQAAILSGKTNLTTFMGCAAGTLMLDVTGEEKWRGSYHYWTFVYTMTYDKDGWDPRPVNAGLYRLNATNQRIRITELDHTGKEVPTQEPQPLGPSGGVIPVAARPGSCIFVEVEHYNELEFADLGLPTM